MSIIEQIINPIKSYINSIWPYWLWILVLSGIATIISVGVGYALIISLPPDYFTQKKRLSRIKNPVVRILLRVVKNVFGIFALIAGCIMLFTPGQGLLTILVGAILCEDLPGMRTLERKLISHPLILSTINRIRLRHRHPPILLYDIEKIDDEENCS